MKTKFLLIAILLLASLLNRAQEAKPLNSDIKTMQALQLKIDSISQEAEYMRYCLYRYSKTRQTAMMFAMISTGLSLISVNVADNKPFLTGAAVAGTLSLFTFLGAERWMKEASIKPADSGFGLAIEF